ncbi:hypothetical protein ACI2UK_13840 [Ralstonia nicotianae]|uniref:hypothetical protein n=1 Tax=Ralstonia pseudosolanacearum TaxID=1310165 RepID=UPI0020049740|nr:hypothetical protein [Ralstonia pseudosolanacearum]MCK4118375.1 hypothetical protein [Ralstonia pseudosolanacearum]
MDKMAIKIVMTTITNPTLLPQLAAIEEPKQRAYFLRQMAELGAQAFAAQWASTGTQATHTSDLPATADHVPARWPSSLPPTGGTAGTTSHRTAQRPNDSLDMHLVSGLPPGVEVRQLNDALSRFFNE